VLRAVVANWHFGIWYFALELVTRSWSGLGVEWEWERSGVGLEWSGSGSGVMPNVLLLLLLLMMMIVIIS